MMGMKLIRNMVSGLLFTFAFISSAFALQYNMSRGVTPISKEIYGLHMTIFWICVAIAVLVFGIMFYSIFKHRKSKGAVAANFHEHAQVEFIWALIPFIILVLMAIPATKVLMRMEDSSAAVVNIKITGYQWRWKYEYLDQGISFFSNLSTPQDQIDGKAAKGQWYLLEVDKPLVLPIHKKIRFLVTSNDVVHSWWVPAFGIKRDAIPGFIHEAWANIDKPGIYRGQCAELCGMHHGFMPIVVIAKTQAEYELWLKEQGSGAGHVDAKPQILSKTELMKKGEATYKTTCAVCHKPEGIGMPPAFPSLLGSKITIGSVSKHIDIVLHGVKGSAMQAFASQLSDEDIAAVVTYERNAWGNDNQQKWGKAAGGIVQPSDVKAARESSQ
jgi:cytochrome c oxidase subunit 2